MTADAGATAEVADDVGATPETLRAWLSRHRISEVDCAVPDIAGVARGKTMPAEKFVKLDAVHLPISIFHQTITGDYVGFDDDAQALYAESDLMMVPDLSTIRPAPWARSPTAQVIHDATWQNGEPAEIAPRNVLKRVLGLYAKEGWVPVVAPELEFYLTKTNPDPDYPLEPPIGRSGRPGAGRQAYSLGAVDEYDKVVNDIYEFAERQYLKIDTIIQEGGAAQLEINLLHGDAVHLADQVFLFKRTIREAAFRHGCYATFMAKPLENQPGSAMHIHQSIIDAKTGKNIFTHENGAPSKHFFQFPSRPAALSADRDMPLCALREFIPAHGSGRRFADQRRVGPRQPLGRIARSDFARGRAPRREPPRGRRFQSLSRHRGKPCLRLSRHEERARAARSP